MAEPDRTAVRVVAALGDRRWTVAVAESLTGGLLAAALVDVPGASMVFRGGLLVYATDLKASLGGVSIDLLAERGPVDPDVAVALAAGVRTTCGADWGLSTTGVAGPDPQGGKAVGTVHLGWAGPDGAGSRALTLDGNRAAIRRATVTAALDLLLSLVAGPDVTGSDVAGPDVAGPDVIGPDRPDGPQ